MEYPQPITSIDDLPKAYAGLERERFWQQYWKDSGVYSFSPTRPDGTPRSREEIFSVDTPPPTVSGALHIGHVYSYTQTDFSVRYQRMRGKHVFYPFGFDDNGLPTERLVERVTGKRAHEVGREEFIRLCQDVVADAEQQFIDLWQSLALSCDWTQFYTTINERSRAISQASFIDLYNKGYIYRKEAPTQWCWADQTAIAQAEIEDREVAGHFHDIVFHIDDGSGQLTPVTIATTRPELIPACVAVFAHPDDARYKHLFGKMAITPLFEVMVPVLPSEKADPEKGTGILMCCTFGDTDDVEHWEMEWPEEIVTGKKLPTRIILERSGHITDISARFLEIGGVARDLLVTSWGVPASGHMPYRDYRPSWSLYDHANTRNPSQAKQLAKEMSGLKIKEARKWIADKLFDAGLLLKKQEIMHIVRHSERGGVPIEILVTPQWYIKILTYKEQLLEQGRRVEWHPGYMLKRFEHWVEGLNQDWCISRQRYNGVPFPVWYTATGELVFASPSQLPVNPLVDDPEYYEGESQKLLAEGDVMDTWATSSVTPLLNTHLRIGQDDAAVAARHAQIFPYDLRPQAHDIIRTWAFYTITKAFFHFGEIPWKDIVISGHAQDAGGKKISKSKGHVVTPAEMVEKYTADGLRYWSSSCKLGTDTLYDEKLLGEGKRLITKLFNAGKFALRHLLDFDPQSLAGSADFQSAIFAGSADFQSALQDAGCKPALPENNLLALVTYPTDRWVLSRLARTIERATKANDAYEFGDAKQAAEDFFWADFCDNYLELSKGRLYGEPAALEAHPGLDPGALRLSAQAALYIALGTVLKLFAPALPHITEECWSWYFQRHSARRGIHDEPWPQLDVPAQWAADVALGQGVVDVLAGVRKWKSERSVSIKKPLARLTVYAAAEAQAAMPPDAFAGALGDLLSTCNARECSLAAAPADTPPGGNAFSVDCELAEEP